jgi:hypothetical protein
MNTSEMERSALTIPKTFYLDEFGKGTTPVDGIALLATTIKHFATSKAKVVPYKSHGILVSI